MKNSISTFDWKKFFDTTDENKKIGYDVMYLEDIIILTNNYEKYRIGYFVDIFFEKGEFVFELNGEKYTLSSPSTIILQPDSEFRFISCNNPSVYMVVVSKNVRTHLLETFNKNTSIHSKMRFSPLCTLNSEKDKFDAFNYISTTKDIISEIYNPYRLEAFKHYNIYHYYRFFYKTYNITSFSDYGICKSFFILLERYFLSEKDIEFYSKQLNISKGHLDFIVKKKISKTPKACLDERTVMEAKKLLNESELSIEKIAVKLNFSSPIAFSKLFKRIVGVSPRKFRR